MLFSRLTGLPVVTSAGAARIGVLSSLAVDVTSGTVTHIRVRGRRLRRRTVLAWEAVRAVGPDAVVVGPAAAPAAPPPRHDVLGHRVLTEAGDERGTVLDVVFDPASGRIAAVRTTLGDLPAERLLGLGDHALVVRAG
ncbi:PRC-barrel domain-containing protein [Streptomyces sp. NPDC051041]|uniref:PRC-barrel domain-containing protein n=1 Tax=Streptomyces sp. NPDC051041 TaxID=3365640 RepID=UPI00378CA918